MSKLFSVYCHTNKINGKRYVGITSNKLQKRWANGNGYKHNAHFTNAINKYGWQNFVHEVIVTDVSKEAAIELEKLLICLFRSNDKALGYNSSSGGEPGRGVKHTAESRRKMSEAAKGRKASRETREKLSDIMKNRDPALIKKFAHSRTGKKSWNHGICGEQSHSYGREFTEERKRHISEALKGKPKSAEHILKLSKMVKYLPTGEVFNSIKVESAKTGFAETTISNHCRGVVQRNKWEFVKGA